MSAPFPTEKLKDEEKLAQIISSSSISAQLKDPENSFLQFLHLNISSIVDLFLRKNIQLPYQFYVNSELIFSSHCEQIKIMMSTDEELLSVLFSFLSNGNKDSTTLIRGRFYKVLQQLLLLSDIDYLTHISEFKSKTVIIDNIEQKKNIGGILFLSLLVDNIQYLSILNFLINIINSHTYSVITFFEQNFFTQILLNKIATINKDTSLSTLYSPIPFFDENDIITTEIDQTSHIFDLKMAMTQNIFRILLILTRTMSRTSPLVLPLLKPERIVTLFDICTKNEKFHKREIIELIENLHKQNHESSREAITAINKKLPEISKLIVQSEIIPDASKLDIKQHIAEFGLNKPMKDVDVALIRLFASIVNDIYGFGGLSEEEPIDFTMKKNFAASDSLELFNLQKVPSDSTIKTISSQSEAASEPTEEKKIDLNQFDRKKFTFEEATKVNDDTNTIDKNDDNQLKLGDDDNNETKNIENDTNDEIKNEEINPFQALLDSNTSSTSSPFQVFSLPNPNPSWQKTPQSKQISNIQPSLRPTPITPSNRVRSALNSTPPAHKSSLSFIEAVEHPRFLDISPISKDAKTGENLSLLEIAQQTPTNPHYDRIFNTNQRHLDELPSKPFTFSDDEQPRTSFSDSPREKEFIPGINLDSSPHEIFPLLQSSPAFFPHKNYDLFANSSLSSNASGEIDSSSYIEDETKADLNSKRSYPSKSLSTPALPALNQLSPLDFSTLSPIEQAKSPNSNRSPFDKKISLDYTALHYNYRYDNYSTSQSARVVRPALLSETCFTIQEDPTEGEEENHQQEEEEEEFIEEEERFIEEEEIIENQNGEEEQSNIDNALIKKKDKIDSCGSLGSLINSKRTDIIINTTCFLLHQIFDNSLNSNLHHAIIDLIETLEKFTSLLPTIIYRSKILNRIIDDYKNTKENGCINMPFAGYLTKIAEIVQKLQHKLVSDKHSTKREGWKELDQYIQSEDWKNYIKDVYQVKSEIMNKNYGGFIPELTKMIDLSKDRVLRSDL